MKKNVVLFLAGLLVGGALSWGAAFLRVRWLMGHLTGTMLAGQVHVLQEIRRGQSDQVAERIESSLPDHVRILDESFPSSSGRSMALGMVSRYYERERIPPPEDVREILERLVPTNQSVSPFLADCDTQSRNAKARKPAGCRGNAVDDETKSSIRMSLQRGVLSLSLA